MPVRYSVTAQCNAFFSYPKFHETLKRCPLDGKPLWRNQQLLHRYVVMNLTNSTSALCVTNQGALFEILSISMIVYSAIHRGVILQVGSAQHKCHTIPYGEGVTNMSSFINPNRCHATSIRKNFKGQVQRMDSKIRGETCARRQMCASAGRSRYVHTYVNSVGLVQPYYLCN